MLKLWRRPCNGLINGCRVTYNPPIKWQGFSWVLYNCIYDKRSTSSNWPQMDPSLNLIYICSWPYTLQVNKVNLVDADHLEAVEALRSSTDHINIVILRETANKSDGMVTTPQEPEESHADVNLPVSFLGGLSNGWVGNTGLSAATS